MKKILLAATLALLPISAFATDHHEGKKGHHGDHAMAVPDLVGAYTNGHVTVTYMEDGHYILVVNATAKAIIIGKFKADDGKFTVVDKHGKAMCNDGSTGTYDYTEVDGTLTFSVNEDKCEKRYNGMTSQPWKLAVEAD